VDAARLRALLEQLDEALDDEVVLDLHGGSALLMLGMSDRTTMDIDVLPTSHFVDSSLRRACETAGILFEPMDTEFLEREYIEVIPEATLVLPRASDLRPYTTAFRGKRLTVRIPPPADLVVGKLKRAEPEDLADIAFLARRFALTRADVEEAFCRLPRHLQEEPVIRDNLRYVLEDHVEQA
jgi:hypothetical protein